MNNGKCFFVGPLRDDPPHPGPARCHFLPKVQNSLPRTACLLETPSAPFLLDSVYPGSRGLRPHCKGGPPRRTCFRGACCRDSGLSRRAGAPAQGGPSACSGAEPSPHLAPAAREPGPSSASLNSLEVSFTCHSPSKVYHSEVSSTFPERCNPHRCVISKHICLP